MLEPCRLDFEQKEAIIKLLILIQTKPIQVIYYTDQNIFEKLKDLRETINPSRLCRVTAAEDKGNIVSSLTVPEIVFKVS